MAEFVIENEVLKQCKGRKNAPTIPSGVTSIGSEAFFGCENLTIHAPASSCAETYAQEHYIKFQAI